MKKVLDKDEASGRNPSPTRWTWFEKHWMAVAIAATVIGLTLIIVSSI